MNLAIIILAAGKGTRMESDLAKVLHPLQNRPLLAWALEAASQLQPQRTVVVVGHQAQSVEAAAREVAPNAEFALQSEMLGTGHAVQMAHKVLCDFDGEVLVTCGDTPLLSGQTLQNLVAARRENDAAAAMLVADFDEPGSYGRVLCDENGSVSAIVEAKDASPETLHVKTVNAGAYCFRGDALWPQLERIDSNNKSGELYLTDVIGLLTKNAERVQAVWIDPIEMTGVNTRAQLQELEELLNGRESVKRQSVKRQSQERP